MKQDNHSAVFKDWAYVQEQAYDDESFMDKILKDDSPITAFIEWLQKKHPNGIIIKSSHNESIPVKTY